MPRVKRPAQILPLVCAFLLALAGCGSTPPAQSLEGVWTGTLTDSMGRPGTASLTLIEDRHDILHGNFSYLAGNCSADSKPVIGKVAAMHVSLSQAPPDPVPTSLQMAVNSTDQQLSGTYNDSTGDCGSQGTISLTKPLNQAVTFPGTGAN